MSLTLENAPILVAGAGIMGSGIAQVAAQAGHPVMLFDVTPGAAASAHTRLGETLARLVAKGKFSDREAQQTLQRIEAVDSLDAATGAGLVIEAVVEDIDIKRSLFQQLEALVSAECVLASNTSSLSISALASGLAHPERVVGMHFFNPVPIMRLVEVISALQTSSEVAEAVFALSASWGKLPVHARSTPGFIVNRIARPFYAEALALLQERAATPEVLDACARGAGFRMGPCELMDLIGHDTNLAVTRSVYQANFYDKRYTPSIVQQELVDGGLLGRKSGRGFYDYSSDRPASQTAPTAPTPPGKDALRVHGSGPVAAAIAASLAQQDCSFETASDSNWIGLQAGSARLRLTDGRCAEEFGGDTAVFDLPLNQQAGTALAWSCARESSPEWVVAAANWLTLFGFVPQPVSDTPGLVVARTVAMLINEAADAVQQGVCDVAGADAAMKLGLNYPAGPFEWLAQWNAHRVIELLDRLDHYYRGERYRVSPWLRHKAWGASVLE